MKEIYNVDNYKVYETEILGYKFYAHKTRDNFYSLSCPMGVGRDKLMFDELCYRNRTLYTGDNIDKIIADIKRFIEHYKETNPLH